MSSTSGGLLEVAEEWPSNSSDIKEREGGRERERSSSSISDIAAYLNYPKIN